MSFRHNEKEKRLKFPRFITARTSRTCQRINDKVKIPLADIVSASYVMGAQNSEKFWNSIIEAKKVKDKANMYTQRYIKWRKGGNK